MKRRTTIVISIISAAIICLGLLSLYIFSRNSKRDRASEDSGTSADAVSDQLSQILDDAGSSYENVTESGMTSIAESETIENATELYAGSGRYSTDEEIIEYESVYQCVRQSRLENR